MRYENVYFINGTAYAGKSTMVKLLVERCDGIACEENYRNALLDELDSREYPNLTYIRELKDGLILVVLNIPYYFSIKLINYL